MLSVITVKLRNAVNVTMGISGSSLKLMVLASILYSFDPLKIGLRRKDILDWVLHSELIIYGSIVVPLVFLDPLTSDEKNSLNQRLLRMLKSLVKEGLIIRVLKDNKQVFYLIDKDALSEVMECIAECQGKELSLDNEEWIKSFRDEIISRSTYLKLPDYFYMIPIEGWLFREITLEEFRSRTMKLVGDVLEPQILEQYEIMTENQRRRKEGGGPPYLSVSDFSFS